MGGKSRKEKHLFVVEKANGLFSSPFSGKGKGEALLRARRGKEKKGKGRPSREEGTKWPFYLYRRKREAAFPTSQS